MGSGREPCGVRGRSEVGHRYDGDDAEGDVGVEMGGELRYANGRGLAVEIHARSFMTHDVGDYEEWDVSA